MILAIVAIVISVMSLAIAAISARASLASARAAERQAAEAGRVRQLEEERRHEEREPVYVLKVKTVNGQGQRLSITVASRHDVDLLAVTIERTPGLRFRGNQEGVDGSHDSSTATLTGLRVGARDKALRITSTDDDNRLIALRLDSHIGDEQWTTRRAVRLPKIREQHS